MHVEVDASKCVTGGQCVIIAPSVFDQDDEGLVVLLDASPDESQRELLEEAEAVCPAAAIRVLAQVPPA